MAKSCSVAGKRRSPVACHYGRIRDVLIRSRRRSEAELAERLGNDASIPQPSKRTHVGFDLPNTPVVNATLAVAISAIMSGYAMWT